MDKKKNVKEVTSKSNKYNKNHNHSKNNSEDKNNLKVNSKNKVSSKNKVNSENKVNSKNKLKLKNKDNSYFKDIDNAKVKSQNSGSLRTAPEKNDNFSDTKKKSRCPVSRKCGGCQFIDVPYKKQLDKKQKQMEELLGGFCKVSPIVGMEEPEHYRNKVHAVFSHDKRKGIISGIYQEGTHDVVSVDSCFLENEKADAIIVGIREMLKSFKIRTYDEDTGYGLLRHVMVRTAHKTGQIMVVLVTSSPVFPSKNNFVKALRTKFPEITTIVQNINDKQTSMVLGTRNVTMYGKGYIEDELCGKLYRISPNSFYQINSVQTEKMYQKAMEYAELTGKETVIDSYCGIGTIGLTASGMAKKVIGVELNKDAVKDAVVNAKANQVTNADFYQNDAGKFMVELAETGEKIDVVFMDPPRSGSTEEFMDAVFKLAPKKVVYISCGPDTLARDLKYFKKGGYQVKAITPYDLFPFTGHVESVVLITRKDK